MSPNRYIREGINASGRVNSLSPEAELFFRRLLNVVDDYARYYANPTLLRAACFPRTIQRISDEQVSEWLEACRGADLVEVYKVEGEPYLRVKRFQQTIRAERSKFPYPGGYPYAGETDQRLPRIRAAQDARQQSDCTADAEQPQGACRATAEPLRTTPTPTPTPRTTTKTKTETRESEGDASAPAPAGPALAGFVPPRQRNGIPDEWHTLIDAWCAAFGHRTYSLSGKEGRRRREALTAALRVAPASDWLVAIRIYAQHERFAFQRQHGFTDLGRYILRGPKSEEPRERLNRILAAEDLALEGGA